jgi:stress-induced morphogen
MIAAAELRERIQQGVDASHIEVVDTGGGDHFRAVVVSPDFEGKSRVQQHQLVYRALGDHMRERVHALALRTLTPRQWEEEKR